MKQLRFYIKTYSNGSQTILFNFIPTAHCDVFLYYHNVCLNLDEFNEILADLEEQRKLPSPTKNLGRNDSNLIVYGEKCRLDCEFISGLPPLEISTEDVIYFFTKFRDFYIQYQECQIPGLIPESKLNTWSCVPNEYIKPEYWDLLKQQQEQKDNEI